MNSQEFREFLNLLMVSDPFPLAAGHDVLTGFANRESRERGFTDWIDAYHRFAPAPPLAGPRQL